VAGPELFTPRALTFLRALKRNNDSAWFQARKADYVAHIQEPLHRLIAALAEDLHDEAPELACSPRESTFRIYRDTRFSDDKSPLKTHVAAHFPSRGRRPADDGAGLYLEVAPTWVWFGGGLYMPSTSYLQAIREHVAATHPRLHRIVTAPAFRKLFGGLQGARLSRVPRGYLKDHPAAHYLQHKQFYVGREFPAEFATADEFYPELVRTFKAAMPLVRFLNAPNDFRAEQRNAWIL
jgi:uncharacterized protein (TIGR02453 family)